MQVSSYRLRVEPRKDSLNKEGGDMTPSEIKRYLTERKMAPLNDIALHFDMEPDAVRGLLGHWIRKGKVRLHKDEGCSSGGCCSDCGTHAKEVYEWLH